MKSIRLSLLLYFVALVAVVMGAVAYLVYQTAERTLQAKKATTQQLIHKQYEDLCAEEKARLDAALLAQARTLARLVQFDFSWNRTQHRSLHALGILSAAATPNGHVLAPLWLAQGRRGAFSYSEQAGRGMFADLGRSLPITQIKFDEDELLKHVDGHVAEYVQINSTWQSRYLSQSLAQAGFSFPFDPKSAKNQVLVEKFDDVPGPDGKTLRRVLIKETWPRATPYRRPPSRTKPQGPLSRSFAEGGNRRASGSSARAERPPTPPPPSRGTGPRDGARTDRGTPAIFVQCACDTSKRDEALAGFRTQRDEALAQLEFETEESLRALWQRLFLIALVTFVALAVGGYGLVYLGLSPLRRLTEAVSQVSEKDFRLPLQQEHLPSELRPIAERLNQTLELLKRAFAREKQAAADISHELRTPLAALLTTTEVALRKPRPPEEYRSLLEDCRTNGQHMSQLVERLLVLARLDAGADTLQPQRVDVSAMADQCVALVRPLAQAHKLEIRLHRHDETELFADPDKLREILTNLLHNAIQYNRPEGSIDVEVQRKNGYLEMAVRDTGIGIAPEAHQHIFERFFRADPARQADGLHAGIGLAIVKGYVELMGGTIEVESTLGQGSTFRVNLPAHKDLRH